MGGCKRLKFLLCLLFITLLTTGCNVLQSKEQDDKLPVLTIGSDIYPPFFYVNEKGEPDGIDVLLAKEACRRIGYRPKFEIIDWKNKDAMLAEGRIDCLWSCFSIQGRENEYRWTDPFMVSAHAVAVPKDSKIYKLADLQDKVVAVQAASQPEKIFLQNTDARIPPARKVIVVEGGDMVYSLLVNKQVDAVADHEEALAQFAVDYDVDYRLLEEPLMKSGIGVAFYRQDQRGIDQKLSKAFNEMNEDGTVQRIADEFLQDAKHYLIEGVKDNG